VLTDSAPVSEAKMPSYSQALWQKAIDETRTRSPASFEQWFSSVQFDGLRDGVLGLTARDEFVRDWVKAHFLPDLLGNLNRLLGQDAPEGVRVEWRISPTVEDPVCVAKPRPQRSRPPPAIPGSAPPSSSRSSQPPSSSRAALIAALNPKHTFPNFVVGPSNELAYAAAFASAGGGGPRYNPLFIAGGTGLGKTHLMHAIAHKVLEERPDARVIYVSAEHFTNEFIEALQHHKMDDFRARYRSECDLLLLDDIQFLAGREQTQEEFFHTFNALHDADKAIVVTSDKYPHQLQRMPERLVSRFTSGLVADVQVPQLETRVAIVRKKAEIEGISVSDEVAVLLAQSIQSNVRELEGALIRLAAKSSLTGRAIDAEFTRSELAMVAPRRPEVMSVEDIQRAVCNHFRLSNAELLSKDRHKSVAFARQVAMYLCRQRLKCSFPELGRAFGNRDHTTVMSAVRRVEQLRQKDPQVNAHLEAIEKRLASSES
jgi:chromosomal replication initiator protein